MFHHKVAVPEEPERSTVDKILLIHEFDGHGHAHRAMRYASAVAGGLSEFLFDVQRVPVA